MSVKKLNVQPHGSDRIGDLAAAEFYPGRPVAVVTPIPVTRFNLYAFVDALAGRRSRHNRSLRVNAGCCPDALNTCPGGSLAELLDLPADATVEAVRAELLTLAPEAELPTQEVHAPLDRATWRRLDRSARAQILLAQAVRDAEGVLVVAREVLRSAGAEARSGWWRHAGDTFVAVRYGRPEQAGAFGERAALALGEDRAVALMSTDWARANAGAVEAWLADHAVEARAGTDDDSDDE